MFFAYKICLFSVDRVEFEMAMLEQRKMASVAYSRTNGQISISSQHCKGITVCLVCSETKSSIPSVDRLV